MHNITLISTIHSGDGACNPNELHKIIEAICPEVIFLEAMESCYTNYDHLRFTQFGITSERLEIKAFQKYLRSHPFRYVPVLDDGLPDWFSKKSDMMSEYPEWRKLVDNLTSLTSEHGFQFLNSKKSIQLHNEMRELEKRILGNNEICQKADADIDAYENSMLRNIYAYSNKNSFSTGIFMCGSGHRGSIIEKIQEYETPENVKLKWAFYGS